MSNMTLQDVLALCTDEYGNARLDLVANDDGTWTAQLWAQRIRHGQDAACGTAEDAEDALALMVADYCEREGVA